jgi:hypothetical protein
MGQNLSVPIVQEFHCGANNVCQGIIVQEQRSKLKKRFRGLRFTELAEFTSLNSFNQLIFIMKNRCVFFEILAEFSDVI